MSQSELLGVCGDDCDCCPRYIAAKNNDRRQLEAVLALWVKLGWRDAATAPEDMRCSGCSFNNKKCAYPEQLRCASARRLGNCGECNDYPCAMALRAFQRAEDLAKDCQRQCSKEEYQTLRDAFFRKKKNLDAVHARGNSESDAKA